MVHVAVRHLAQIPQANGVYCTSQMREVTGLKVIKFRHLVDQTTLQEHFLASTLSKLSHPAIKKIKPALCDRDTVAWRQTTIVLF